MVFEFFNVSLVLKSSFKQALTGLHLQRLCQTPETNVTWWEGEKESERLAERRGKREHARLRVNGEYEDDFDTGRMHVTCHMKYYWVKMGVAAKGRWSDWMKVDIDQENIELGGIAKNVYLNITKWAQKEYLKSCLLKKTI